MPRSLAGPRSIRRNFRRLDVMAGSRSEGPGHLRSERKLTGYHWPALPTLDLRIFRGDMAFTHRFRLFELSANIMVAHVALGFVRLLVDFSRADKALLRFVIFSRGSFITFTFVSLSS